MKPWLFPKNCPMCGKFMRYVRVEYSGYGLIVGAVCVCSCWWRLHVPWIEAK